jgi:hypothetical protein
MATCTSSKRFRILQILQKNIENFASEQKTSLLFIRLSVPNICRTEFTTPTHSLCDFAECCIIFQALSSGSDITIDGLRGSFTKEEFIQVSVTISVYPTAAVTGIWDFAVGKLIVRLTAGSDAGDIVLLRCASL